MSEQSKYKQFSDTAHKANAELEGIEGGFKKLKSTLEHLDWIVDDKYVPWRYSTGDRDFGSNVSKDDRDLLDKIACLNSENVVSELEKAIENARNFIDRALNARVPLGFGRGTVAPRDVEPY